MNNDMESPVLVCRNLRKSYKESGEELEVLKGVDLVLKPSERIAIVGTSGSGKTTLLQLLAGLDKPTDGEVKLRGHTLSALSDKEQGKLRNRHMGFVYQFHHLLPEFSALENVAMPLLLRGDMPKNVVISRAEEMLDYVGLIERAKHKPAQLSGGERQRVAIARALVGQPDLVLMDEPTGNLDPHTAGRIQHLMEFLSQRLTTSFIVVTHDLQFAAKMNRVFRLHDGRLLAERRKDE